MSGPRKPRRRGYSRRAFLKKAGMSSAAAGLLPLLPGCGSSDAPGGRSGGSKAEFRHGVASGDPLPDAVMLWTRVSGIEQSQAVDYVVARDTSLADVVLRGSTTTDASRDYTVKVDATGLEPGVTYYYRFSAGAADSPVGRTKTAADGSVQRLRVGVVSCASLAHGYFNAYGRLAQRADLDVILHLGDYIYEYGTGEYGDVRDYEPSYEILTLDDYRTRHAQYKQDADVQAMHRQHPMIAVWDDHETADNSWRDGANNHTEGAEGAWTDRKAAGIQAYYEWMPIRQIDPTTRTRIFRTFRYGDLADFVMLDTRLYDRDLQAGLTDASSINDEARTLIGPTQMAYLGNELAAPGVTWKIIGQQVMFGQLRIPSLPELSVLTNIPVAQLQELLQGLPVISTGGLVINTDQWDGYGAERSRVFDLLEAYQVSNPVVLTGDIHTSWGMDLSRDPANPLVYNPLTGEGSLGVEFVSTSVTSPGLEALAQLSPVIQAMNPHMKYIDLAQKGYLLLDITPERTQGEWWYVDTVAATSDGESFGAGYVVAAGSHHLVAADAATEPALDAPPLVS
ncbi:alkaline phosphatase D family protein [Solimonas marina]|uniref:Twin-arginine translocation signal domain-containing protein n=1 Tax=Solimonas marina TaxID=2714601 RepID=A0A969WER8_9GAMM|nr:alkaline phosphatase D family protein [Solimonas marina]NKF23415.1 twin-arginine translocation signal domain-containing protein [Solimonas marina]